MSNKILVAANEWHLLCHNLTKQGMFDLYLERSPQFCKLFDCTIKFKIYSEDGNLFDDGSKIEVTFKTEEEATMFVLKWL